MNQFMEHNWWMFACAGAYFAGIATILAARLVNDLREDKQLPEDYKDLTRGRGYDEKTDTTRILKGFTAPALPVPISPSPLLHSTTGGYETIGTRHLNVDQRYQTLQWLNKPAREQWQPFNAPVSPAPTLYQAAVMRQHGSHAAGEGRHRKQEWQAEHVTALTTQTCEIDLNDIWARISEEDSWSQQGSTSRLPVRS